MLERWNAIIKHADEQRLDLARAMFHNNVTDDWPEQIEAIDRYMTEQINQLLSNETVAQLEADRLRTRNKRIIRRRMHEELYEAYGEHFLAHCAAQIRVMNELITILGNYDDSD